MENERIADGAANASIAGCLIPVFWMLVGNGILAVCAVSMIGRGFALFGLLDVLYWLTVGCLLTARYVDVQYLGGRTTDGASATMAHWRRYAVVLVVVSAVLWIVVHLIPDLGL